LSTSGGIATTQLAMPAIPPANNVFNALNSLVLKLAKEHISTYFIYPYECPSGVNDLFKNSYEEK
jgi:hypothetical protein